MNPVVVIDGIGYEVILPEVVFCEICGKLASESDVVVRQYDHKNKYWSGLCRSCSLESRKKQKPAMEINTGLHKLSFQEILAREKGKDSMNYIHW